MTTRLILITLLVMISGPPAYAEWLELDTSDDGTITFYVDPDTIRRRGDLVKMWNLIDLKTPQSMADGMALSIKRQGEYDCAEERARVLAFSGFSDHMGIGKVVSHDVDAAKWEPVAPGSIGQTLWKVACSKK